LKILFSSSEGKFTGGNKEPISLDSFIFGELYDKRLEILNLYQNALDTYSNEELSKLLGFKKEVDILNVKSHNVFKSSTTKAILRYSGVGYKYLDYQSLNQKAQSYIDENVLIFSNLFGIIKANDYIPFYKIKQNEKLENISISSYYKNNFSKSISQYIKDEEIIDLRSSAYKKFYPLKISEKVISPEFLKDNKVVSHYAKAYRGEFLRKLAENYTQSIKEIKK